MKAVPLAGLLLLPACNLLPADTTSEQQAIIQQHELAVAAKRAEAQRNGLPPEEEAMLKRERAEIRAQQDADAALRKRVQRESALKRELASWRNGRSAECATVLNYSTCALPPETATEEDAAKCYAECDGTINAAFEKILQAALTECGSSDGAPACRVEFPKSAARRNGEAISDDGVKGAAELCSKECVKMRAEIAVDVIERPKAAASGEALVLSYKRCMVAADSTRQAITYRLHDTVLYQDLMAKADVRCRATSRCDWLEKHSDEWRCSYGN